MWAGALWQLPLSLRVRKALPLGRGAGFPGAPQALSRCVGRGQEDHGEGMMGAELKLETSPDFVRKSEGTNSAFSLVRHPCVSMWASGRGLRG